MATKIPTPAEVRAQFDAAIAPLLDTARAAVVKVLTSPLWSPHEPTTIALSLIDLRVRTQIIEELRAAGWIVDTISDARDGAYLQIGPR